MYTYILISIFIIWFLVSIVWQFKFEFLQRIGKYDIFQLLPNWTFFAPNPGISDYHLLYRTKVCNNSEVTNWVEIPFIEYRRFTNFVWNPNRRYIKFLIDCINNLLKMVAEYRKDNLTKDDITKNLCLSVPYLLMLNCVYKHVDTLHIKDDEAYVQFAIVESFGILPSNEPEPLIVSTFHQIK